MGKPRNTRTTRKCRGYGSGPCHRGARSATASAMRDLCKTAELAENPLAVHVLGTMRWLFVGEALVLRKVQCIV